MRIIDCAVAVLWFTAFAQAEVKERDILFYAPYSRNADAAEAIGSPKASVTPGISLATIKGRTGLVIAKGTTVSYQAAGNLNPQEGTAMFWFKPDWRSGDRKSHTFLQVRGKGMILRITKGYADTQAQNFLYLLYDPGFFNAKVDDDAAKFFTPDTWVHVAAAWSVSGRYLSVYVNGEQKTVSTLEGERPQPEGSFWIGSADGFASFAEGTISDFRIYRRALTGAEIKEKLSGNVPTEQGK